MSRPTSVLLAATLLVVLAAPSVQADHSSTSCSGIETHIWGPAGGCTLEGLYFDPKNDSRDTVEIATLEEGATFTGKIKITFKSSDHTERLKVGMIAGTIDWNTTLGDLSTDEYDVTVDILAYKGIHPTGNWQVTINHHKP